MSKRKRFTEKQVIATLIHQGVPVTCFRTKEPVTLENLKFIEREHLHERELGGPDEPGNCRYSLKAAHNVVTNGTPATTAGSSKNRIAKANNPNRTAKFVVNRVARLMCAGGVALDWDACPKCGATINEHCRGEPEKPKRKIQSRGFPEKPEGYKHNWRKA